MAAIASQLNWAAHSDLGRRRSNNEDSWGAFALDGKSTPLDGTNAAWPRDGALYIVSDGIGGARGGEVASRFCVDHLAESLGRRSAGKSPAVAMREAILEVHQALFAKGEKSPELHGMGATLSALWLRLDGKLIIGHVGDSRIYGRRAGAWSQLTEDQSVGAGMVRRGELTEAVASRLKFRSLLEQAMGGDGAPIEPQIKETAWEAGDVWVLCSDGLYGPLGANLTSFGDQALTEGEIGSAASALVAAANEAGGPDNITILLARVLPL
jgi:protein phosphatase